MDIKPFDRSLSGTYKSPSEIKFSILDARLGYGGKIPLDIIPLKINYGAGVNFGELYYTFKYGFQGIASYIEDLGKNLRKKYE